MGLMSNQYSINSRSLFIDMHKDIRIVMMNGQYINTLHIEETYFLKMIEECNSSITTINYTYKLSNPQ